MGKIVLPVPGPSTLSGTSPPMHLCAGAQGRKRSRKRKLRESPALGMTSRLWNLPSCSLTHSRSGFPSWFCSPTPPPPWGLDSCLLHPRLEARLGPIFLPDLSPLLSAGPFGLGSWAWSTADTPWREAWLSLLAVHVPRPSPVWCRAF